MAIASYTARDNALVGFYGQHRRFLDGEDPRRALPKRCIERARGRADRARCRYAAAHWLTDHGAST